MPPEVFFRTQRVTLHDGSLIVADEKQSGSQHCAGDCSFPCGIPRKPRLTSSAVTMSAVIGIAATSSDMALDLTAGREGLDALAKAMRRWIAHLLGIDVDIEALTELQDVNLAWYVGLDVDATKIGDMLWNGEDIEEAIMGRVVGLFRLRFRDPAVMTDKVR